MKTATVRELRNHYTRLLAQVAKGEEIIITQRGVPVARLSPEPAGPVAKVDWGRSPAVTRDRSSEPLLSAEESAGLLNESSGRW